MITFSLNENGNSDESEHKNCLFGHYFPNVVFEDIKEKM